MNGVSVPGGSGRPVLALFPVEHQAAGVSYTVDSYSPYTTFTSVALLTP